MDKRDTPLLAPVEDAMTMVVSSYIEQLKAEIAALKQQLHEQLGRAGTGTPA